MGKEFRARLRPKPGSILADGSIVLARMPWRLGLHALTEGTVVIERHRFEAAKRHGWSVEPRQPGRARAAELACAPATPEFVTVWRGNPRVSRVRPLGYA